MLVVDITVHDVNDNPPKFQNENYSFGVSEKDNTGKILFTLYATDPDLNDVITYYLLSDTITATGNNLEEVKNSAFQVNQANGDLTLQFQLLSGMSGFFEFQVQARDQVNHTDEAFVKIFLIADSNRVSFTFLNDLETVQNVDKQLLEDIFSSAYESVCVINEIIRTPSEEGGVQAGKTDVRVHFIRNNEAIDKSEISE